MESNPLCLHKHLTKTCYRHTILPVQYFISSGVCRQLQSNGSPYGWEWDLLALAAAAKKGVSPFRSGHSIQYFLDLCYHKHLVRDSHTQYHNGNGNLGEITEVKYRKPATSYSGHEEWFLLFSLTSMDFPAWMFLRPLKVKSELCWALHSGIPFGPPWPHQSPPAHSKFKPWHIFFACPPQVNPDITDTMFKPLQEKLQLGMLPVEHIVHHICLMLIIGLHPWHVSLSTVIRGQNECVLFYD